MDDIIGHVDIGPWVSSTREMVVGVQTLNKVLLEARSLRDLLKMKTNPRPKANRTPSGIPSKNQTKIQGWKHWRWSGTKYGG